MKLCDDFVIRTVAGQAILIDEGSKRVDFNGILSLNEPAAWLWRKIKDEDVDFDVEILVEWLLEEYDVEPETARNDVKELVGKWLQYGVAR